MGYPRLVQASTAWVDIHCCCEKFAKKDFFCNVRILKVHQTSLKIIVKNCDKKI